MVEVSASGDGALNRPRHNVHGTDGGGRGRGVLAGLVLALAAVGCIPDDGVEPDVPDTTTAALRPSSGAYRIGQCVTWDQDAGALPEVTGSVPCAEPHLLEVTGSTMHPSLARYPTEEQWGVFYRTGACRAFAEEFVGGPVDPFGVLALTGLKPTATAWTTRGVREVTCGLGARDDEPSARLTPKVGTAVGREQAVIRPVGACLHRDPATSRVGVKPVPCTAPHSYEVTGVVSVAGRATERPADRERWDAVVGADCRRFAESLLGQRPDGRAVRAVWFDIEPESWAAGRRKVECAVGRYDEAGEVLAVTGLLSGAGPPRCRPGGTGPGTG